MNIVEFRRIQALKDVERVMSPPLHSPGVMPGNGQRHFNVDKDALFDKKKIITVDDVIYGNFDKVKKKKGKGSVLFKIDGQQKTDKEGDPIPNKHNKKALLKYLKDETKRINFLDE